MGKLIFENKIILDNMKYATSALSLANGLMFARKKTVKKGICLVMPSKKDVRYGASITMFFCFHPLDILFINSNFEVVDKKRMYPWQPSYTPKEACKYVIESEINSFKNIKIGDIVKITK